MKKKLFLLLILLNFNIYAQVSINADNSSPDSSAMLDVQSTNKGMLIPRMSNDEMLHISSPAEGLLVYNKDNKAFYYYDNSNWILASADNLGNHKATENLQMQGHWISNDGDNEGIFVQDNGDVGIRTNNPEASLHILMDENTKNFRLERNQDVKLKDAGVVSFRSRGTNDNKTALEDGDAISALGALGHDGTDYTLSSWIRFYVDGDVSQGIVPGRIMFNTRRQDGDWDPRMVIKNDGKVGINTSFPKAMLHLKGDDPDIDLDMNSAGDPAKIELRFKIDGTQKSKIYYRKDTHHLILEQLDEQGQIRFNTNFRPAMVITYDKKVGVGTTLPKRKLHLDGIMRLEPLSEEPSDPSTGDIYMDDGTNNGGNPVLRVYDGTEWKNLW